MRGNTITLQYEQGRWNQTEPLFQYDYGQKLILEGIELPLAYEVHFANAMHGNSKTSVGDSTGVEIPDEFLQTGQNVYFWLYLHSTENDGETELSGMIPVSKRAKPTNDSPTPVQQDVIEQTLAALEAGVMTVEAAKQAIYDAFPAGGSAGYVLTKASDNDYDAAWLPAGGGGGTSNYQDLDNKPMIEGTVLEGDISLHELGAAKQTDIPDVSGKTDLDIIAPDYADLSFPIVAGQVCIHDGVRYKAKQDIQTSEDWTESHWEMESVEDSIQGVKSQISQKQDAPSATGTAGQALVLDNNLHPVWDDVSIDPEDIAEAVDDWLDEHPEATTTVEDGSVSQKKLSFAELVLPGNLFDYTSENMCITGSYYNESTVGNTVSLKTNQYTTGYAALKIPIYNVEKVTVDIYPNSSGSGKKVYWIGAVDSSMKLLSYNTANQQGPVTFTIPSGTEYVLISYSIGANDFNAILPKVMVASGESISGYYSYFTPYYILNGCKVDVTDTQKIQSIVGTEENTVKFKMPDTYDAIVNEPIQIFFKGIVDAVNYEMFYVQVLCDSGNVFDRYFELTPTQAGNITATFNLYGINHNVLDTKTVTFVAHARPTNPAAQKNVLCVGDSLTQAGEWVTEFSRRLTGSGGSPSGDGLTNINFIGTRQKNGVNYEGYGGWTFNSYNTEHTGTNAKIITCSHDKTSSDQHSIYKDSANYQWKLETIETGSIKILAVTGEGTSFPSTGTLTWVSGGVNHSDIVYTASANAPGNPFWINGGVDFEAYAEEQGVSTIDYVLVLLGWNNTAATESEYKTAAQTFITNVHTDFPNAKIILMGLEIPARNGLGINYKATNRHSYYNLMQYVFNIDKWYKDLLSDNSNTYSANLSGQFDTEYNMQTTQKAVNSRNETTITFQSNGLHPANPGYLQIADAFYRKFVSIM